jgi:hypothetical protein
MDRLERILTMLEYSINTKRKKHLAGGILLSVSMLFGGLAATVLTLKMEENNDEQERYLE